MATESELLALVQPQYHSAFKRFIDTGEADQAFLEYSRRDDSCKKAIDLVFIESSRVLEELAMAIRDCTYKGEADVLLDAVKDCRFSLT